MSKDIGLIKYFNDRVGTFLALSDAELGQLVKLCLAPERDIPEGISDIVKGMFDDILAQDIRVNEYRQKQSENGLKGVLARQTLEGRSRVGQGSVKGRSRVGQGSVQPSTSTSTSTSTKRPKEPPLSPTGGSVGFDPDFISLWEAYPKHRRYGRPAGQKYFRAAKKNLPPIGQLLEKLEAWKHSEQWQDTGGRYVPGMKTFFDNEYWLMEIPETEVERAGRITDGILEKLRKERNEN